MAQNARALTPHRGVVLETVAYRLLAHIAQSVWCRGMKGKRRQRECGRKMIEMRNLSRVHWNLPIHTHTHTNTHTHTHTHTHTQTHTCTHTCMHTLITITITITLTFLRSVIIHSSVSSFFQKHVTSEWFSNVLSA